MTLRALVCTHVAGICWLLRKKGTSANQHADKKCSSNYFGTERANHISLDATASLFVSSAPLRGSRAEPDLSATTSLGTALMSPHQERFKTSAHALALWQYGHEFLTMAAESFALREASAEDVPALARLHVVTFSETHGGPGPTYETREWQWREAFAQPVRNWFCFVIARDNAELIGFAKGMPYTGGLPGFSGELNKIYILRQYHRRGLGRRTVGHVTRRFLAEGIDSMLLFGDARNPSNGFYETLGAERLLTAAGEFHGGYGWRDLRALAEKCPDTRSN